MRVELTPDDLQRATDFCIAFRKLKPKPIRSHATEVEVDWQLAGKLAEIAVGKVLSLTPNFEVFLDADQCDFTLADGRTLSVRGVQVLKTMDYSFKVIQRKSEVRTDLLSLVLISPDKTYAQIEGYIETTEFFSQANVEEGWAHQGPTTPYVLSRDVLKDFAGLQASDPSPKLLPETFWQWYAANQVNLSKLSLWPLIQRAVAEKIIAWAEVPRGLISTRKV